VAEDGNCQSSVTLRTLGFNCSSFLAARLLLFAVMDAATRRADCLQRPWVATTVLIPFAILEAIMTAAFATWNWVA
jgi:hypothetical protein